MIHSEQNFALNLLTIADRLKGLYDHLCDSALLNVFEDYRIGDLSSEKTLKYMIFADVALSIDKAGHNSSADYTEALPMKVVYYKFLDSQISLGDFLESRSLMETFREFVDGLKKTVFYKTPESGDFNVSNAFEYSKLYVAAKIYYEVIFEMCKCIAYADGNISKLENAWLGLLEAKMNFYTKMAELQK